MNSGYGSTIPKLVERLLLITKVAQLGSNFTKYIRSLCLSE